MFETYYGIKIGIGAGFWGSFIPASNTTFTNWIPDLSKSNIFYKH